MDTVGKIVIEHDTFRNTYENVSLHIIKAVNKLLESLVTDPDIKNMTQKTTYLGTVETK